MTAADRPDLGLGDIEDRDRLPLLRSLVPALREMAVGVDEAELLAGAPSFLDHVLDAAAGVGGEPVDAPTVRKAITALDRAVAAHREPAGAADAVRAGTHHVRAAARTLRDRGLLGPAQSGRIAQINVSDGGVPKRPVPSSLVDRSGLTDDRQANRVHHGRPNQALSLWSAEVIAALAAEGHPISAGSAGENLTVAGLDWAALRPGQRLRIGDEVEAELSLPAVPCRNNAQWFADGDFRRIDHKRHPGRARWYAWVLRGGEVRVDDEIRIG